jgi:adenosyl cobinamide kinase/adenosyl cobinamide phosphate guanylyltransferase
MPSVKASKLKHRKVEFLWDRRLAIGMATLLTGETQSGKSTLATAIAAAVTRGGSLPGGPKIAAADVVWLAAEEHPEMEIKDRLAANDADLNRVHFAGWNELCVNVHRPRFPSGVPELVDFMLKRHARLLIVDPIGSFLDPEMAEENGHTAREVTQALTDLAVKASCAVLFVKHPRKDASGSAINQVSGSKEWVNQPRGVLVVAAHPNAEDLRVVCSLKSIKGQKPSAYDFTFDNVGDAACLKFLHPSSLSAEDILTSPGDAVQRSALAEAKEFLRDRLGGDEKEAKAIMTDAENSGISKRTLERAKHELSVTSHCVGPNSKRYQVWRKPAGGWPK